MKLIKRNLLSFLVGLFDPLGYISPVIVCVKILFQNLCCENRDWDEELEEIQAELFMSALRTCPKSREFRLVDASMKILNKRLSSLSCTGLGTRAVRLIAL